MVRTGNPIDVQGVNGMDAKSSAWMCLHYYHLFDCYKQVYTIYRVLYILQGLFISIISFDPHSSRNHDSLSPDEKMGSNEAQRGFLVSARSHSKLTEKCSPEPIFPLLSLTPLPSSYTTVMANTRLQTPQ